MTGIQPYLYFHGRCDEALDFYTQAIGAKVTMRLRFKDAPTPPRPGMLAENMDDKVMHASMTVGGSEVSCSDGHCTGAPKFEGFSLSLTLENEAAVDAAFNALAAGGQVRMPLEKTFFSPRFGMLTDKFGVAWIVMCGKS